MPTKKRKQAGPSPWTTVELRLLRACDRAMPVRIGTAVEGAAGRLVARGLLTKNADGWLLTRKGARAALAKARNGAGR